MTHTLPERSDEAMPFMTRHMGANRDQSLTRRALGLVVAALLAVVLAACGDTPLESIGLRSSDWINEPTVPSTVVVDTTVPRIVSAELLQWANNDIVNESIGDHEAMLSEVFERREGDRFIQASSVEIAAAVPDIAFPDRAPTGAEWVSSQLVFENDGTLSNEPSAAFGIWSAEPYTRSRSVAQMIVIRVSNDLEAANELATGAAEATCSRFADRSSDDCEIITVGSRETWVLGESSGSTLIWYDGPYRYEMFGRSFVPSRVLQEMSGAMVPLTSLPAVSS